MSVEKVTATQQTEGEDALPADCWLVADQIFDGEKIRADLAVRISERHILDVAPKHEAGSDGAAVTVLAGLLSPGFFDIQVNGGGGILFNSDPTAQGLLGIAAAHAVSGTTSILPTLITDTAEVMHRAADAVIAVYGNGGIAGLHLEGPHISIVHKGAHKAEFIRTIDDETFAVVERVRAAGVPLLITLAPECVPRGTIARLVAYGAVVSLGHSAADFETARAAISEGAMAVTHLYNAMPPMKSREPGLIAAALDSGIYCGVIADGHHVDATVLRLAMRARPKGGRMIVVSDAMPTWNGPPAYDLYGETIRLAHGRLVNSSGSLAGVHIDMAQSVKRLVHDVGLTTAEALHMATQAPATLMGLQRNIGVIGKGARADFVLLSAGLEPVTVFRAGQPLSPAAGPGDQK